MNTGLESPVNRQAGKPALQCSSATGRKFGKQLSHCLPLPRQDQIRRDLTQWLQYEPPQMGARMRKNQFRRMACFIAERDQIQVERARFVQDFFGCPAKFSLQGLKFSKQRLWRFVFERLEPDNGIYKHW